VYPQVITLKKLFEPEAGRKLSEPAFGRNVCDVLDHIYETEQRFVRRDKRESVLVKPERGNALTVSLFGMYPTSSDHRRTRMSMSPEKVSAKTL
jgi:hypothetical protein